MEECLGREEGKFVAWWLEIRVSGLHGGWLWSGTTYLWWLQSPWNPPGGVSSPIPGSEEVDSDLSMVGCFPGRAPNVENLNKLPARVSSALPIPSVCLGLPEAGPRW